MGWTRWPTPACASPARSATWTSSRSSSRPARSSPTPAASRTRPPRSASAATRCGARPSGSSTLTHGTNVLLGDDPDEIAEVRLMDRAAGPGRDPVLGRPRGRARRRRARPLDDATRWPADLNGSPGNLTDGLGPRFTATHTLQTPLMYDDNNTNLTLLEGGFDITELASPGPREPPPRHDRARRRRPPELREDGAGDRGARARAGAFRQVVVHTGQHYDAKMSDEVLADLDFPAPDRFLKIGSGAHGAQTAKVLLAFEQVLREEQPVAVVVAGDVNSTLGCALAAAKHGIPVAHVEAGLRSFDWEHAGGGQPRPHRPAVGPPLHAQPRGGREPPLGGRRRGSHPPRRQHDDRLAAPLRAHRAPARVRGSTSASRRGEYALVTLHRPSNVDDPAAAGADRRRAGRDGRPLPGRVPGPPAHPRAARRGGRRPARGRRRALHRARSATSTSSRCSPAPAPS